MLSRTAENLYWLARYVERAEYLARTIDATLRVTALPAAYIGKTNEWESALMTAGSGSFIDDLVGLAGGTNLGASAGEGYPNFSTEVLVEKDPAVYVAMSGSMGN